MVAYVVWLFYSRRSNSSATNVLSDSTDSSDFVIYNNYYIRLVQLCAFDSSFSGIELLDDLEYCKTILIEFYLLFLLSLLKSQLSWVSMSKNFSKIFFAWTIIHFSQTLWGKKLKKFRIHTKHQNWDTAVQKISINDVTERYNFVEWRVEWATDSSGSDVLNLQIESSIIVQLNSLYIVVRYALNGFWKYRNT